MLETHSRVVPLADIAEVIDERLHRRVVLIVDIRHTPRAEGALLQARIVAPLLLRFKSHREASESDIFIG